MPTPAEIVQAVWDEVINGATARQILAAWLRFLQEGEASSPLPPTSYAGGGFISRVFYPDEETHDSDADDMEVFVMAFSMLRTIQ